MVEGQAAMWRPPGVDGRSVGQPWTHCLWLATDVHVPPARRRRVYATARWTGSRSGRGDRSCRSLQRAPSCPWGRWARRSPSARSARWGRRSRSARRHRLDRCCRRAREHPCSRIAPPARSSMGRIRRTGPSRLRAWRSRSRHACSSGAPGAGRATASRRHAAPARRQCRAERGCADGAGTVARRRRQPTPPYPPIRSTRSENQAIEET